jgi:hypothetical protein
MFDEQLGTDSSETTRLLDDHGTRLRQMAATPSAAACSDGVAVTCTSTAVAALSPARSRHHYRGVRATIAAAAAGRGVR